MKHLRNQIACTNTTVRIIRSMKKIKTPVRSRKTIRPIGLNPFVSGRVVIQHLEGGRINNNDDLIETRNDQKILGTTTKGLSHGLAITKQLRNKLVVGRHPKRYTINSLHVGKPVRHARPRRLASLKIGRHFLQHLHQKTWIVGSIGHVNLPKPHQSVRHRINTRVKTHQIERKSLLHARSRWIPNTGGTKVLEVVGIHCALSVTHSQTKKGVRRIWSKFVEPIRRHLTKTVLSRLKIRITRNTTTPNGAKRR